MYLHTQCSPKVAEEKYKPKPILFHAAAQPAKIKTKPNFRHPSWKRRSPKHAREKYKPKPISFYAEAQLTKIKTKPNFRHPSSTRRRNQLIAESWPLKAKMLYRLEETLMPAMERLLTTALGLFLGYGVCHTSFKPEGNVVKDIIV